MRMEEALFVWEENAKIFEKALVKVSVNLDTLNGPKQRPLERSTSMRWRRTLLVPSTPSTSTRCWGRRRSSTMGENETLTCARRRCEGVVPGPQPPGQS
jgi:hypothetical protein